MESASDLHINRSAHTWHLEGDQAHPEVYDFHRRLPGYEQSPLVSLDSVAQQLGIRRVLLKRETERFTLTSFKILGASWAAVQAICQLLGLPGSSSIEAVSNAARNAGLSLATASQGNHGLAVSKMAALLSISARVFIPFDSIDAVEADLREQGAEVIRCDGDYDVAIAQARSYASNDRIILVQDTAWECYEQIPTWVVQGYSTILREIDDQLNGVKPDMIVTPVGVGSLAEAVTQYCKSGARTSKVLGVEPTTAGCLLQSLRQGRSVTVQTRETIMSGMNCGTLSTTAWPILKEGVDFCLTIPDAEAHECIGRLSSIGVQAGPCGAAAVAGLRLAYQTNRDALGLSPDATVVLICTEGSRPYRFEGSFYPTAQHAQDGQTNQRIVLE